MTEKSKKIVNGKFSLLEPNSNELSNTGFVRRRCYIAYPGKNRNYTNISKQAFEEASASLLGVPVVGNWTGSNYGGHDIIAETKGNEYIVRDKTIPLGFVPQDANVTWEEVEDEDGNMKLYQVSDVVLWHKRFPEEVDFIIENGVNQSMEIEVLDGDYDYEDYFDIKSFEYQALCLLGKDDYDPENNVEPCFEDAGILAEFSKTQSDMIKEMKDTYNKYSFKKEKGGGSGMSKENIEMIELEKYNEVVAELAEVKKNLETTSEALEIATKEKEEFKANIEELNASLETINSEVEELREFKASIVAEKEAQEIAELEEEYAGLLPADKIEEIKTAEESITVEEFSTKLALALAEETIKNKKSEKEVNFGLGVVFESGNVNKEPKDKTNKFYL